MGELVDAQIQGLRAENSLVHILDNLTQIGETNTEALKSDTILARLLDYDWAALLDNLSALMRGSINSPLTSIGCSHAHCFSDVDKAVT